MCEMAIPPAPASGAVVWNATEVPLVAAVGDEILPTPNGAPAMPSSRVTRHLVAAESPGPAWHSTGTSGAGTDAEGQPIELGGLLPAGDQTVIRLWEGVHCRLPVCFDVWCEIGKA
mgnify:CR=1 FL=1